MLRGGAIFCALIACSLVTIEAKRYDIVSRNMLNLPPFPESTETHDSPSQYIVNKDEEVTNDAPVLLLHVGPGKTGTTSIQNGLSKLQKVLEEDGYQYIGNNNGPLTAAHMYNKTCQSNCGLSMHFVHYLEGKRHEGFNLVGSNEFLQGYGLAHGGPEWRKSTKDWKFLVVLTYRRMFEVIPSLYSQHYKKFFVRKNHEILPITDYFFRHWMPGKVNYDGVKRAYYYWQNFTDEVRLFNFHQEGDILSNFICQNFPEARYTCAMSKGDKENRLVHKNHSLMEVSTAIKQYQEEKKGLTTKDLPQRCLNNTHLDNIFRLSLDLETWAFSVLFSQSSSVGISSKSNEITPKPLNQAQMLNFNASWDKILEKQSFCSVDAAKVMKQKSWRDFFEDNFSAAPIEIGD